MRILIYELKKLLSTPALWGFVALCIAFNIWTMPTHLRNVEFDTTTPFPANVFENYNTSEIAEAYISMFGLTGRVSDRMTAKYDALQTVASENALAEVSFSPYLGEFTQIMHINLFHGVAGVVGRLLLQGMLLAVLLALLAIGFEQINNTEHSVYATKTGRRIIRHKIAASLITGTLIYLLLTAITLTVYFSMFDFGDVWSSNVSSGFNYVVDVIGTRAFITWQSFTVLSYLLASLGVSVTLVICFSLIGILVGTLSKNSYVGFLMVMLVNAVCLALPLIIPMNSYAYFASFHTPIWLWWNSHLWFTDGGVITLWRNFELWGAGISLLVLSSLCMLAVKNFEKRNIA